MTRRTTKQLDAGNEWLRTHTLRDVRELAQELSDQGEDVSELVRAVRELEELLAETKVDSGSGESPA